ncbi:hypothetical protein N473_02490 [Pseudoalteromonas luteoviolacea CPMOR-1]|uniref:Uncharacterized protein n=1 Tax=Pseudoalteromonas luteoviolacea CPMOR-1 TaxID=1365248 RepID=A0A167IPT2_9GAMM|nr:hypothetical protein [Pseudoalteromonas luteoviolacea]KZN59800.1 hypothetical protein N473_02490 [Pseudoalteromonas luteoviolacea CPMOR-1]
MKFKHIAFCLSTLLASHMAISHEEATISESNKLGLMQLLYNQSAIPELRKSTNELYSKLSTDEDVANHLLVDYYMPYSQYSIHNQTVGFDENYGKFLVKISGDKDAEHYVGEHLGKMAYSVALSSKTTSSAINNMEIVDYGPDLDNEQRKALVFTLWELSFNEKLRTELQEAEGTSNKASLLSAIKVNGYSLDPDSSSWIAQQLHTGSQSQLENFLGYNLYAATW